MASKEQFDRTVKHHQTDPCENVNVAEKLPNVVDSLMPMLIQKNIYSKTVSEEIN